VKQQKKVKSFHHDVAAATMLVYGQVIGAKGNNIFYDQNGMSSMIA